MADALVAQLGKLVGTWSLDKSEKFDEYMKAVDVGFVMRKLGSTVKPDVKIGAAGDEVFIRSESSVSTHEIKFKLGEEFVETTADGRKPKTVIELKDGKLIQVQKGDGIVPSTITRELQDDNTLVCTCEAKDVVCKRYYKRNEK
ncbi:hypothetical protein HELRODRAFT_186290 [Helobdella robusta]|uniref:Lipocalin/cytosolic fatty-acid binding domain-containing protein n=1 Tax=Helobdella robusta TaxID=6412 RepID=T1FNX6_HELRO|nr:hypothetical protein HELRODRAFT_186290 [Helobdella robusta]ESO09778.1 hypothetical protein HELRODRAFT_186290 [Helobdella robusta]